MELPDDHEPSVFRSWILNVDVLGLALSTPLLSASFIAGSELFERRPARIGFLSYAGALGLVEIGATARAQPAARITANPGHWYRQIYLLADYIIEIKTIIPVKSDQKVVLGQLSLFARLKAVNRRNIKEIKALVNVHRHGRKASGAIQLNRRSHSSR
jgi:hypothetical protein